VLRERVLELLDRSLDTGSAMACVEHVAGCAACRADLAHNRRLRDALARQARAAPASLRARVAAMLGAHARARADSLAHTGG